uniref:U6 snRNA-associated Sm-like protein LSm1 n=1 Tax=Aureoumbra lagunensis TaxID=44058 RepID=A0A7S3JVP6_9STRA
MPIALPAAASLVDQLDKKVMILLRDGRHLVGIMRSFDQFSNLVLEETFERRVVVSASGTSHYGDIPLGLYVVRGDAVILLGNSFFYSFIYFFFPHTQVRSMPTLKNQKAILSLLHRRKLLHWKKRYRTLFRRP